MGLLGCPRDRSGPCGRRMCLGSHRRMQARRRMRPRRGMRPRRRMSSSRGSCPRCWTGRSRRVLRGRCPCHHRRTDRRALLLRHRRSHRRAGRRHRPRISGRRGRARRLGRARLGDGRPGLRRQARRTPGTRSRTRRLSSSNARLCGCSRRPPRGRGLGRRRRLPDRRRRGRLSLIVIIRAQVLPRLEPSDRSSLGLQLQWPIPQGGQLRHGPRRLRLLLTGLPVFTQELAGSEPAEHSPGLGRTGSGWTRLLRGTAGSSRGRRDGRPSWEPRPRPGPGGLGIQLDVALRADDPVALLQVVVEPQLGHDARDDAQAGGERQIVHRRHVEGARHRHLQAAPIHREREHEVLLGQCRRDDAERG